MSFNQKRLGIDFIKHSRVSFIVSGLLIGLGLLILTILGLNLGVDFESGTRLEILMEQSFTASEINQAMREEGYTPGEIQLAGNDNEIAAILFKGTLSSDEINHIKNTLTRLYGEISIKESTVSPDIARELARQAIYAVIFASIAVMIYVSIRFEYRFAIAAIIALLHDVLIVVAIFSILRLQVDLTFIAALLTIVGYSINDTIVIFDRIRENLRISKIKTTNDLYHVVNQSINETLPRSINTSLTVIFAAATLFLIGGEAIRLFSFALLIGLVAGAYSSIFIATQVWLVWKSRGFREV